MCILILPNGNKSVFILKGRINKVVTAQVTWATIGYSRGEERFCSFLHFSTRAQPNLSRSLSLPILQTLKALIIQKGAKQKTKIVLNRLECSLYSLINILNTGHFLALYLYCFFVNYRFNYIECVMFFGHLVPYSLHPVNMYCMHIISIYLCQCFSSLYFIICIFFKRSSVEMTSSPSLRQQHLSLSMPCVTKWQIIFTWNPSAIAPTPMSLP